MQRIKSLLRIKHSFKQVAFVSHQQRSFSALPDYSSNDYLQDQVLVEGRAKSRAAILNRPSNLNALNTSMVGRLKRLYESWEENPDIGFVLMKVAILDGITMGCGAGISLQGMYRVVTDKTVFSNPETQMGFHPDAGASFYLSHLPGYLGEYLALTGEKLNGVEMIACGLATHYTLNGRLPLVEERVGKLITDDPSIIETSLAQYGDLVSLDRESVLRKIETIDKCFSHDTIEEIIDALENEAASSYDVWCRKAVEKLKEASPLSLKVTLQSIREGRFQSLDQCLVREYRITLNGISKKVSNDFCEGIRARLVDKDFAPKWDPPSLADVSKDMVDCYFSPFDELEPELQLPTALREPYI
ncbi:3-hydroxyisobutyryl-CoA hydrolase-like protein 2 [Citrus sinensis]|uniref:3-hydroxyisobutyryl-CoA hydrolase-like protein 2 n=1 Tax=Citrus sinensis TaxID=2711 RepID=A0ACB8NLY1_CITSI|nr:3-hydroxyisobutyryl-CoA hydrolase-like protein 2 [Citrus sinensis]KAH9798771.1 3-hydroxyisobutyryl-CoA hydrolase-like protein 2 [Citrus sinensis]